MIDAMRGPGLKGMAGAFDEAVTTGLQRQRTTTEILTDLLRAEAIPRLRNLIQRVTLKPAENGARSVSIEVTGKLASMLALATGKPEKSSMYGNIGAGEGIRTLDPNLGKVVLYP